MTHMEPKIYVACLDAYNNGYLDSLSEMAVFISEHGKLGAEVLKHTSEDINSARDLMEDYYQGEYDNKEDFARILTEQIADVPDYISNYIDYDRMAQEMFDSGDYFSIEVNGKTHIFRSE